MTSRSLWYYYGNDVNDNDNENNADNYRINKNKTITSKSFTYKTKIIASTSNDNNALDAEFVFPLKYFCNFWRSLDSPLINCETELDLKGTKNYLISEIYKTPEVPANPNANPPNPLIQVTATTGATFQINNAKLYVAVVTLSINDDIKFLENKKHKQKAII